MPALNTKIEIIVADDHPIFLDSLKRMVDAIPEFKLAGAASNGQELIELSRKLKPDIVITDILMPVLDGIEATKQLTKEFPGIGIIALSMVEEECGIIDMLEAGAKGYLLKNAHINEVILAVKTVHKNERYFSKDVSNKGTNMVANGKYDSYKNNLRSKFSEKEIAVMKLICQEFPNKQIAHQMGITKRSVDGIRDNILKKINAKNTVGIVIYAIKNKIYQ